MQIEIHSYRDVGQVLRDMRLHLKLDPRDIGQQLHIRAKYLTALEEGNLEELPGKVYARGYLRQYAEFLGLNAEEIANAFDRVQSGERNVKYFVPEPTS
ncbi:MAG: helix-turn-helix domain-containing protein, partial [Alphaproteobacteria bacterium]|nr:helix-turn-helix domain-containing protein [Alphaproteobacteria bacterium]